MTRLLVLEGHQAKGTFCGALAAEYANHAQKGGNEVRVRHLADLDFDADFGVSSFKDSKPLEHDLAELWQDILWLSLIDIPAPTIAY